MYDRYNGISLSYYQSEFKQIYCLGYLLTTLNCEVLNCFLKILAGCLHFSKRNLISVFVLRIFQSILDIHIIIFRTYIGQTLCNVFILKYIYFSLFVQTLLMNNNSYAFQNANFIIISYKWRVETLSDFE